MIKLLIITILLFNTSNVLSLEVKTNNNDNNGPVTNIMDNLAQQTSNVTTELVTQLATKIRRTIQTLVGNIEVVITSAVQQLAQPIEDFQSKIQNSQCQPLVTLQDLKQQIDTNLNKCTLDLKEILTTFQTDANDFNMALEKSIKDIINLPQQCQSEENNTGFGSNVSCYVEKISEVNKEISVILNTASMTLVHTRQLTEKAVQEGRSCADNVVSTTVQSLNQLLTSCQLIAN